MMDWLGETMGLFFAAYGTALALALLLPWLGVLLVLRQRVFTAAAVAQSAAFGFAVGLYFGIGDDHSGHGHDGPLLLLLGASFGVFAGMFSMQRLRTAAAGLESWSAVLFLLGSSGSMLLLSNSPHGMQDIQRLQLSSLLGATPLDLAIAVALLAATLVAGIWCGPRILLVASDEGVAQVLGLPVRAWRTTLGVFIGLCLSFAIHATGLLFAFGCTVLPVLFVREVAPSLRAVLWLAPSVSVATVGLALWLAQLEGLDLPPGQTAVAVQAAVVALAMAMRRR
jgi:ABC-type Mn2+/Zn2+ transport system permease subunit